jgi:hypothetical protein
MTSTGDIARISNMGSKGDIARLCNMCSKGDIARICNMGSKEDIAKVCTMTSKGDIARICNTGSKGDIARICGFQRSYLPGYVTRVLKETSLYSKWKRCVGKQVMSQCSIHSDRGHTRVELWTLEALYQKLHHQQLLFVMNVLSHDTRLLRSHEVGDIGVGDNIDRKHDTSVQRPSLGMLTPLPSGVARLGYYLP